MNREIKFRVWILSPKEYWTGVDNFDTFDWQNRMRNVDSIHFPLDKFSGKDVSCEAICDNDNYANGWTGNSFNSFDTESTKEYVLMQYTGLKDKNGKEIYEGDILGNPKNERGTVIWDNAGFCLKAKRKNNTYFFIPLTNGFILNKEVIGNIYENP